MINRGLLSEPLKKLTRSKGNPLIRSHRLRNKGSPTAEERDPMSDSKFVTGSEVPTDAEDLINAFRDTVASSGAKDNLILSATASFLLELCWLGHMSTNETKDVLLEILNGVDDYYDVRRGELLN